MQDSDRADTVTTVSFRIPSCSLTRANLIELARPVHEVAGAADWRKPTLMIQGTDRTLTCQSLNALEHSSWPRDIRWIYLQSRGEGDRQITFSAFANLLMGSTVEISGQDALWVQGLAQQYRDALNGCRNWHWLAGNPLVYLVSMLVGGPLWINRLFPYIEVESGLSSRASVLRRRLGSATGIVLVLALAVAGNVLYNVLK